MLLRVPPPPPTPPMTLNARTSTISPTKHPTDNTIEVPLDAVNSLEVNLIPFTNTSTSPTV